MNSSKHTSRFVNTLQSWILFAWLALAATSGAWQPPVTASPLAQVPSPAAQQVAGPRDGHAG